MKKMLGKKVIVRAKNAGVFYGVLESKEGNEVVLTNARKLWYWDGACAVEELAVSGTLKPNNCKFTVKIKSTGIIGVTQILPTTKNAQKSIEGVKPWKRG